MSLKTLVLILCSYEATSSRKSRSLAKELTTGAVASVFLVSLLCGFAIVVIFILLMLVLYLILLFFCLQGFGSLFLLLSSGVYV